LQSIAGELEGLSDERSRLWARAGDTDDPHLSRSVAELSERIDELWASYRWLRSAIRHGSYERICRVARREEALLRELKTREARAARARCDKPGHTSAADASSRSKKRRKPS
jgi:hypothetical protein